MAWYRKGFRWFWTWKVRQGQPGRPLVTREVRDLIRRMCRENPTWGAPRIHGELLKLGIDIGQTSVTKYMVRCRKPPSPNWRTFLQNHISQLVSIDFFTVPTIRFQVLYVFLVLAHDRRRILHFNVTRHPTAEWTGQQLRNAFPFDQPPSYLLRDRDAIYGQDFREQVGNMGIEEVLSTPRSPWQRAYVERLIGSIRRECLDHVIVFDERSLRRILAGYFDYYHRSRTHLSLGKTRRSHARSNGRKSGRWWRYLRSVACTIATNDGPPETAKVRARFCSSALFSDIWVCAARLLPSTWRISFMNANHLPNRFRDPNLVIGQPTQIPCEICVRHRGFWPFSRYSALATTRRARDQLFLVW